MLLTDIGFCVIVIPLAILSTIATFVWKGLKWMAFIPAILWLMIGLFTVNRPDIFTYQGYLSLIFFGFALAMLFMPWAMREGQPIESPYEKESNWWDEPDETYGSEYEKLEKREQKGRKGK